MHHGTARYKKTRGKYLIYLIKKNVVTANYVILQTAIKPAEVYLKVFHFLGFFSEFFDGKNVKMHLFETETFYRLF